MRKIISATFLTLDGVMQAPGGPEDGFAYGGWEMPFQADPLMDALQNGYMQGPFELLLGKTTYAMFAAFWPSAPAALEATAPFNQTRKYVVAHEPFAPAWHNSVCITGDVVAQIRRLKAAEGPDLWVHGSGQLMQTLLEHQLLDRMHVSIHPLTLGTGRRLFAAGTPAARWNLVDAQISPTGIIFATYEPAGDLPAS